MSNYMIISIACVCDKRQFHSSKINNAKTTQFHGDHVK